MGQYVVADIALTEEVIWLSLIVFFPPPKYKQCNKRVVVCEIVWRQRESPTFIHGNMNSYGLLLFLLHIERSTFIQDMRSRHPFCGR